MPANAIRTSPQRFDREELRAFHSRVVKLRARVFQHDLTIPLLKKRVEEARRKLAASQKREPPLG